MAGAVEIYIFVLINWRLSTFRDPQTPKSLPAIFCKALNLAHLAYVLVGIGYSYSFGFG
jgi:hypothetical protein